jgi:hypothetical protein
MSPMPAKLASGRSPFTNAFTPEAAQVALWRHPTSAAERLGP